MDLEPNMEGESDDHTECLKQSDDLKQRLTERVKDFDRQFVGGSVFPELLVVICREQCNRVATNYHLEIATSDALGDGRDDEEALSIAQGLHELISDLLEGLQKEIKFREMRLAKARKRAD